MSELVFAPTEVMLSRAAEVLDQVIANIRARMDLRRMVTVLTAQGKFSSWIVAAVPVGAASSQKHANNC